MVGFLGQITGFRWARAAALLAVASVVVSSVAASSGWGTVAHGGVTGDRVDRVAGADRYQTAVEVAVLVGGGSLAGLDRLIVVSGESFPDGLAASGLAGFLDDGGRSGRTAILLTQSGVLPPVVADAIRASGVPADRILIVGGVAAVSDAVRSQIAAAAGWDGAGTVPVTRIAGQDRYETAAAIVNYVIETAGDELPASYSTVLVASGEQFPDALAAGSLAYRNGHLLLLSPQPAAPAVTLDAVGDLTADCAVLIGGTAALAPPVATQLDTAVTGTGCGVERIAGQNRYDTAAQVADRFVAVNGAPREPLLASGVVFADALTTGPLTAGNRPLLLTTPDQLPAATSTWLRQQRASINELLIIGGTNTISPTVGNEVNQDLSPPQPTPSPTTPSGPGPGPGPGPTPFGLAYASTTFSPIQTSQVISPTLTGAVGTATFSAAGTLPAGVSFDTSTGQFTGPAAWDLTATTISAGGGHSCALLDTGGEVRCWGSNNRGQLGEGTTTPTRRLRPVTVTTGAGTPLTGVTQISADFWYSCAALNDGTARCWGSNDSGRLGDGTTTNSSTPVTVTTGAGTPLTGITQISAGGSHACALLNDGTARCWGWNGNGGLGDGTTTNRSTPVTVTTAGGASLSGITQISAGGSHTCALLNDGEVRCWGSNNRGQLGDGTTTRRLRPVTVTTAGGASLTGITQISAGGGSTCAVISGGPTGEARCWGWNDSGRLGNGTGVEESFVPLVVVDTEAGTTLSAITQITVGDGQACTLLSDGTARCWGRNSSGQLGDGTTTNRSIPVTVTTAGGTPLTGITQISAGREGGNGQTCAVTTGGTARCWGGNNNGQLGDSTTTNRSTPVVVLNVRGWPAAVTVTATDSAGSTTSANITLTFL